MKVYSPKQTHKRLRIFRTGRRQFGRPAKDPAHNHQEGRVNKEGELEETDICQRGSISSDRRRWQTNVHISGYAARQSASPSPATLSLVRVSGTKAKRSVGVPCPVECAVGASPRHSRLGSSRTEVESDRLHRSVASREEQTLPPPGVLPVARTRAMAASIVIGAPSGPSSSS